ncbi:MAG: helix-turn-helix transcriptional regulator [Candidatus Sungbacteria bacterium]|nr:helix-turn-helix transcriptional regulator [Candidatus Sungbacteria bacterium]
MKPQSAKIDLKIERVLKSLANRRRLAILKYLAKTRFATVNDIAEEIHLSHKSTSKHLKILTAVDILEHEQSNKYVFYRVADDLPTLVHPIIKML